MLALRSSPPPTLLCAVFVNEINNREAAAVVRDLIITSVETDPYCAIKAQLIQQTGESSQQEIQKLLTGEELGDRKLSELPRTMNRRAASHNVPKELVLEPFLQQLLTSVQTILASIMPITVDKAAEVADSILETILQCVKELHNEEITLACEIVPEIDHFRVPGNLVVGITKSFKKEPRNALHPTAIKKKRIQRGVIATTFSQPHISRRLFIKDKSSNTAFLIDTGSDVSVLPASISEKRKGNSIQQLSAANTSPINVYGKRLLTLDLNLRRVFRWPFLIASVSVPIIGADFLYNFNISPDLRNRKFIDNATKPSTNCKLVSPEVHSIKLVSVVKHLNETSGPPVFAKARRLAPDRLKIAKSEFQQMLNLGHIRPSKSNYASPLHIVPKKDSNNWRPASGIKKRPKRNVKIKPKEVLEWTDEATTAFEQQLAHATLLHHPMPNAPLRIWVDASDFAIGGALAQYHDNVWQLLAFLSMKLSVSQKNWSTYDRELLAIYTMVKRFRHIKLTNVVHVNLDTHTPGFYLPVLYKHTTCSWNSEFGSRCIISIEIDSVSKASCLDYKDIAAAQLVDEELKQLLTSNSTFLTLNQQYFPLEDIALTCDVSTNFSRPFILKDYRKIVFQHLQGLSHSGMAASTKLVTQRFVWSNIRRDIKAWVISCHPCQRSKIHRHTKAPISTFALPDARFPQIHVDFIDPFPPSNGQSYCLTVVDPALRDGWK
ncbi:transposon Tf2-9 polyprotein [Trichonephila clavipes]|nr:transposon Tf2-9 polyprotein [Trichonephila clavipes]